MKKTTVWSKHSENDLSWPRNTLYSTDTRQRRRINLARLGLKTMTHAHCPKDAALYPLLYSNTTSVGPAGALHLCRSRLSFNSAGLWSTLSRGGSAQAVWAAEHQDKCRTDGTSADASEDYSNQLRCCFPDLSNHSLSRKKTATCLKNVHWQPAWACVRPGWPASAVTCQWR